MRVILANPRGFCAGVDRAITIVNRVIEQFGTPIYVRHEIVHNRFVVDALRDKGAIFVDELDQIPDGATVIFSAHGVAPSVQDETLRRQLKIFDATCPLVTKVHAEVVRHARAGRDVVLIGHAGHPEVLGTMGHYDYTKGGKIYLIENSNDVTNLQPRNQDQLAFVTQTTLSIDDAQHIIGALHNRFPKIIGPKQNDICYATQHRQDAVKTLARSCELVLVVGSQSSSNSQRLKEIAEKLGVTAYLIDSADDIQRNWLNNVNNIGITAGASAPEVLVIAVIALLQEWGAELVTEQPGQHEDIEFRLPKILRN